MRDIVFGREAAQSNNQLRSCQRRVIIFSYLPYMPLVGHDLNNMEEAVMQGEELNLSWAVNQEVAPICTDHPPVSIAWQAFLQWQQDCKIQL